jgi:hypothetical protein
MVTLETEIIAYYFRMFIGKNNRFAMLAGPAETSGFRRTRLVEDDRGAWTGLRAGN